MPQPSEAGAATPAAHPNPPTPGKARSKQNPLNGGDNNRANEMVQNSIDRVNADIKRIGGAPLDNPSN